MFSLKQANIYHIFWAPLSYAVPGHARHEPTPSQTKLHVAQRVRPARKKILAKKTSKKVDF